MPLLQRYGALLGRTGAGSALAASLVGRLALGTTGLALLLTVRERAGAAVAAGLVAAAYALSFAVFAPVRARRADRDGPRQVVLLCGLLHPAVLLALVLLSGAGAGVAVLAPVAVLAGATVPPLGGVMRAMWATLAEGDELTTAYSLESVVVEMCFVGGPLLVAGLAAWSGPSSAVLAAGLLVLVGSCWLVATPALRAVVPHPPVAGGTRRPLSSPVVRRLLLTVACVGTGFGAVEVALPAFAEAQGSRPSTAGILLAVWSAGSILGGLAFGARPLPFPHTRQLPWIVAALALGTTLPLLATDPVVMGVLLVGYGLTIAPFMICNSVLLGRAAPPGTTTEAFAWSGSMIFGGSALGNAAAGWLVEAVGVDGALTLIAATGLLALLAAVGGRTPARTA